MTLEKYWPDFDNHDVSLCVETEAETTHESVFLTIHKPMYFERTEIETRVAEKKNEMDLLNHFIQRNPSSGTLLMPIIGESGSGKSHAVRWLEAQLRRHPEHDSFHIIRIPKNTSLKEVLFRILKGLEGKKYDKLRKVLENAREVISIGQLNIKLETAVRSELQNITDNNGQYQGRTLSELECMFASNDLLGAYISDPNVRNVLIANGTFDRILNHLSGDDIDEEISFNETDFGEEIDKQFDSLNQYARDFHQNYMTDPEFKQTVISLLNNVLDGALHNLLDLRNNNLSELFIDLRCCLKEDKKQLILLVEDFTRLAGIQKNLLDVMIREVRTDEKELCIMRTALAVTSGYIKGFDTVATRAVYEWEIKVDYSQDDKDAFVDNVCDLVGRYLNAARLGYKAIEDKFKKSRSKFKLGKLDHWIPEFKIPLEEEDIKIIETFGRSSESNYYLFPYNRNAISVMADKHLIEADHFDYNPRKVINFLLLTPLSEARKKFIDGTFLRNFDGFSQNVLPVDVQDRITNMEKEDTNRLEDYYGLYHFWGGNKDSFDDINIAQEIFTAFNLTPLITSGSRANSELEPDPTLTPEPTSTRKLRLKPKIGSEWTQKWEKDEIRPWFNGSMLSQKLANVIRKKILDDAYAMIRWDCELGICPPKRNEIQQSSAIYLARSAGQGNKSSEDCIFTAISDEDLKNPSKSLELRKLFMALLRNHEYKDWDYDGAENDYQIYTCFVKKAADALKTHYIDQNQEKIKVLNDIEKLMIDTKLLGIPKADSIQNSTFVNSLFTETNYHGRSFMDDTWKKLQGTLSDERNTLIEKLKMEFCIYQGNGTIEHALIPFEFHKIYENIKSNNWQDKIQKRILRQVIRRRDYLLEVIFSKIQDNFGDTVECNELCIEILKTMTLLGKGYANYVGFENLKQRVEKFKDFQLSEILNDLRELNIVDNDWGKTIDLVAKRDDDAYELIKDLIDNLNDMLNVCERGIDHGLVSDKNQIIQQSADSVRNELGKIENILDFKGDI